MKNLFIVFVLSLCAAVPSVYAQERTAGGSFDTQMTWTALSTLVKSADAKADMVNVRVDQVVACSRRGMLYAPNAGGGDPCVVPAANPTTQNTVNTIASCNAAGYLFNPSTGGCREAQVNVPAPARPNCRIISCPSSPQYRECAGQSWTEIRTTSMGGSGPSQGWVRLVCE